MPKRFLVAILTLLTVVTIGSATYVAVKNPLSALEDPNIPAITAKKANTFIDSIGINIHAYYTPIPWDNYVTALDDLNIKYVRDDLSFNYTDYTSHNGYGSNWIGKIQQLKAHGITTLAIAEELKNTPADVVNFVKLSDGAIGIVSGPNEVNYQCAPDGTSFTGQIYVLCPDNLWLNRTQTYMSGVRSALKADPATKNVTIYAPSINPTNSPGAGGFAATADAGDIHHYPYLIDNTPSTLPDIFNAAAPVYPGKPMVMTEIGYPSQPANIAHRPASEQLQATLLPAYLLENFHLGISRTFLFELVDDRAANDYFGLLDDATGRRKPAFSAIQNLTNLLKDSNSNFTAGSLRYQLGGDASGVSSQLFQKSDGSFYIALWQTAITNSPTLLPGQAAISKDISIEFGNDIQTAKMVNFTASATPTESFEAPAVLNNVVVGQNPMILQVVRATASSASSATGSTSATTSKSSTTKKTSGTKKTTATPVSPNSPAPTISTPTPTVSTPASPSPGTNFDLPNAQASQAHQTWWQSVKGFFGSIWQWTAGLFHA